MSWPAKCSLPVAVRGSKTLRAYRDDDQGSAFEGDRGRAPLGMDKHNTMEKACRHLIDFMGIKEQVEKFGFGAFQSLIFCLSLMHVWKKNTLSFGRKLQSIVVLLYDIFTESACECTGRRGNRVSIFLF